MSRWLAILMVLLVHTGALASDYTWRDGYYWRDGVAYHRYHSPCNYGCGWCWKYARSAYQPSHYKNYSAPTIINNVIPVPVPYTQPIAAQGDTAFSYQNIELDDNVDLALLYNQADRLTTSAQNLSDKATTGFMALVEKRSDGNIEVAKLIAAGNAQAAAIRAANEGSNNSQSVILKLEHGTKGWQVTEDTQGGESAPDTPQPTVPEDRKAALQQLLQNKCLSCHSGKESPKGVDLTRFFEFDAESAERVLLSVTDPDPTKRMPRSDTGEPGHPLSKEEIRLFFPYVCR